MNLEVLISVVTSICVCSIFMYWYEKKLDLEIKTLMEEMKKISIEAIEEVRSLSINEVLNEFAKLLKKAKGQK